MATRGRPRVENIFRFNLATDLTMNKKFIAFRIALGVDERTAWMLMARFFNYIAQNSAISATIKDDNSTIIADFCWFDKNRNPDDLIAALRSAGIVEKDDSVHDWIANQPFAAKILRERLSIIGTKNNDKERFGSPIQYKSLKKDSLKKKKEKSSSEDTTTSSIRSEAAERLQSWWNEEVCADCPELKPVLKLNPDRTKLSEKRMTEELFDLPKLRAAIYGSAHARGQPWKAGEQGWFLSYDFLIGMPSKGAKKERPENYVKILEGLYAERRPSTGANGKFDATQQLREWETELRAKNH